MSKITFVQTFNTMRFFLDLSYQRTKYYEISNLCSNFGLWYPGATFEGHPSTRDPAYWEDWIDGVEKAMKSARITQDYKKIIYDEELAFLCVQNYLEHFISMFPFEEIVLFSRQVSNAKHIESDPVWSDWMEAVKHVIYETKELDVSFDPFTFERRN